MSIYSPPEDENNNSGGNEDLSEYAKKVEVLSKMGGRMTGRINMGDKKIVDLAMPTGYRWIRKQFYSTFKRCQS